MVFPQIICSYNILRGPVILLCFLISGAYQCPRYCRCLQTSSYGKKVYCTETELVDFPDIQYFSNDTYNIEIEDNVLETLPLKAKHGLRRNVRVIRLKKNGIQNVHGHFIWHVFPQLRQLYLSYNSINVITNETLAGLKQLLVLDMNSNKISVIKDNALATATNIRHLHLAGNQLVVVKSSWLMSLSKLEFIDLSSNIISAFDPETFLWTRSIKKVDLSNNRLSFMPPLLNQLAFFPEINLLGNTIHCSCSRRSHKGKYPKNIKKCRVELKCVDVVDKKHRNCISEQFWKIYSALFPCAGPVISAFRFERINGNLLVVCIANGFPPPSVAITGNTTGVRSSVAGDRKSVSVSAFMKAVINETYVCTAKNFIGIIANYMDPDTTSTIFTEGLSSTASEYIPTKDSSLSSFSVILPQNTVLPEIREESEHTDLNNKLKLLLISLVTGIVVIVITVLICIKWQQGRSKHLTKAKADNEDHYLKDDCSTCPQPPVPPLLTDSLMLRRPCTVFATSSDDAEIYDNIRESLVAEDYLVPVSKDSEAESEHDLDGEEKNSTEEAPCSFEPPDSENSETYEDVECSLMPTTGLPTEANAHHDEPEI